MMLKVFYEPTEPISASYIENHPAWSMTGQHYHNTYEFYLMTDGDRELIIDGRSRMLHAGDLAIIKPYTLHYMQSGKSAVMSRHVMNISEKPCSKFLKIDEIDFLFDNIKSCIIRLTGEQYKRVREFCVRIQSFTYRRTPLAGKIAVFYIIQFMDYLNEIMPNANIVYSTEEGILRQDMIEAIRYIHSRVSDYTLNLDDVVEHIHMSKSRFCEVFKETTGNTFLNYLNYIRVISIEKELWTTKKNMTVLAEENGFPSADHMARVFKKIYRISPTEYRKRKSEYLRENW